MDVIDAMRFYVICGVGGGVLGTFLAILLMALT